MESITKRDISDLDKKNRFFKDNTKLYASYKHKMPQLAIYKDPSPRYEPASCTQHGQTTVYAEPELVEEKEMRSSIRQGNTIGEGSYTPKMVAF